MLAAVPSYDAMVCPHPLRKHQQEALAAFETARQAGSTRWWVTMPPGAGKTLVGTEVARRLGRRTVVFSPNTAIQGQWVHTWDSYDGPRGGTRRDLRTWFTALTYQSLAVFQHDGDDEEAADQPQEAGQVERLHANGLALIETLKAAGPLTIVLDECHHLLEVWGQLLREVLDDLPEAVVLGLTATPPGSLTRTQAEQTRTLFGPILYEARIPALVKEGTLAPYAELAWLTEPTTDEAAWLREQSTRFQELTTDLFDPAFGSTPLPAWLTQRFVEPAADGTSTWQEIAAREPEHRGRRVAPVPRRPPGAARRGAPPRAAPPAARGRGLAALPGRLAADVHRAAQPGRGRGGSGRPRRPGGRTPHAAGHRLRVDAHRHPHRPGDRRPGDRAVRREAGRRRRHRLLGGDQPRRGRAGPGPLRPRARHRHHACAGHRRHDPATGASGVGHRCARRAARRPGTVRSWTRCS